MKLATFKPVEPSEHDVQTQIIKALAARGWLVCRFNSGSVKAGSRFIRFYHVHGLGSAGLCDLMAFKASEYLMIEVKDRMGKLTDSQVRFRDFAAQRGIKVHCCRSWQDVADLVDGLG